MKYLNISEHLRTSLNWRLNFLLKAVEIFTSFPGSINLGLKENDVALCGRCSVLIGVDSLLGNSFAICARNSMSSPSFVLVGIRAKSGSRVLNSD